MNVEQNAIVQFSASFSKILYEHIEHLKENVNEFEFDPVSETLGSVIEELRAFTDLYIKKLASTTKQTKGDD